MSVLDAFTVGAVISAVATSIVWRAMLAGLLAECRLNGRADGLTEATEWMPHSDGRRRVEAAARVLRGEADPP